MDQKLLIWILLGIVLIVEAVMESIKKLDDEKELKAWYSTIAMGASLLLSFLSYLAAFLQGTWALIFIVGLLAYALQHFFADAVVKRIRVLIGEWRG